MKIKDLIKQDSGFLYVVDHLDILSSAGRRCLLNTDFCSSASKLEQQWENIAQAVRASLDTDTRRAMTDLRHCLMQLHDLQGTLTSLASHTPLNEVELFELKNLSLLSQKASEAIASLSLSPTLPLPDLSAVFSLLDPDHTGIANFYIYDSYDPRLAPLRRELRALQEHDGDAGRIAQLLAEQADIQNNICLRLSDFLFPHHADLSLALEQLAYTDCLLALALQSIEWHLARPSLSDRISFHQLFNPRLAARNAELGLRYQPIDFDASLGVTLITGANMAGKTVLLKSIGTAQLMIQCGMYAPANTAQTMLFSDVLRSIGDDQDEMNGLSSFASEITKITSILSRCREESVLILIDEPARTTNPIEGKALVQALVSILQHQASVSLLTTHYSQLGSSCRKLRVRGFVEDMEDIPLTPQNINRFIDYSLTEDSGDDVPQEALRIASILGGDAELISNAQQYVSSALSVPSPVQDLTSSTHDIHNHT